MSHPSGAEIERRLAAVGPSECDKGTVETLCLRPARNERHEVDAIVFTVDGGAVGDMWQTYHDRVEKEQVALINSRILRAIEPDHDKALLAGDQMFVDFDLSERNLPVGSHIQVGNAVLEITDEPHPGCAKFTKRFGKEAYQWTHQHPEERRRGAYSRVVRGGSVRKGDKIIKLSTGGASTGSAKKQAEAVTSPATSSSSSGQRWTTTVVAVACFALGAAAAFRFWNQSTRQN